MPISDVVRSEKFISAAEAVEMVTDRLGCAQSEASALLFRLVRGGYLPLWWTNKSPDQNSGQALCLAGEERV